MNRQGTDLRRRQQEPRSDLRHYKQAHEPAPREQPERQVVPERHERKHEHGRHEPVPPAAKGDVDVARDPEVVGAVPGAPEAERGVVVRHAAHHVLWGVDAVGEGPEAEEAPWDEEL